MFANQQNDKFAMTKDLLLQTGDVVQFKVSISRIILSSFPKAHLLSADVHRVCESVSAVNQHWMPFSYVF